MTEAIGMVTKEAKYDATTAAARINDVEEKAFKLAMSETTQYHVSYLLDTVGPRVTAGALGLSDARPLRRWRAGDAAPREETVQDRLRICFRVVYSVAKVYGPATASAFLRSSNPQLDDTSVLMLLNTQNPTEQESRIIGATRAFLEG